MSDLPPKPSMPSSFGQTEGPPSSPPPKPTMPNMNGPPDGMPPKPQPPTLTSSFETNGMPQKPTMPSSLLSSSGEKPLPPSRPASLDKVPAPSMNTFRRPPSQLPNAQDGSRPPSAFDFRPGGLGPSRVPDATLSRALQPSAIPNTMNRVRPPSTMGPPVIRPPSTMGFPRDSVMDLQLQDSLMDLPLPNSPSSSAPIAETKRQQSTFSTIANTMFDDDEDEFDLGPPPSANFTDIETKDEVAEISDASSSSVPAPTPVAAPASISKPQHLNLTSQQSDTSNLFAFTSAHGKVEYDDDSNSSHGMASGGGVMGLDVPSSSSQTQTGISGRGLNPGKSKTMKRLSMHAKQIGKVGMEGLERVGVVEPDRAKDYVKAVYERLRNNDPTLVEVQLSSCRLGRKRLHELQKCLETNTVVRKLDLSNRGVKDAESNVSVLTRALEENPYITWVDLTNNSCGHKAAAAVEHLLKVNLNITRFDVQEQVFTATDRNALARSLQMIPWLLHSNYAYQRFRANQTTALSLSGRGFHQLVPRLLEGAERVQFFDCSYNDLTGFPELIEEMQQVQAFLASHNKLSEIPGPSFANFDRLVKLDLSHNSLKLLPDEITELVSVQDFICSHNQLSELPEMLRLMQGLKRVDFSYNNLTQLPDLSNLVNLEVLILSDNQIAFLPDSWLELANLRSFNIARNKLITFPDDDPNLSCLELVDISFNNLTKLPDYFGTFTRMVKMNISNNRIGSLPESICNYKNMEELYINNNLITELPKNFGNIWRLVIFHAQCNKLTALPVTLQLLRYLKELDLSENRLKVLDPFLCTLPKLEVLKLNKNQPLKGMPSEIVEKKPKEGETPQLDFIRQLPLVPMFMARMKLMVVGSSQSGKTSLVECLRLKSAKEHRKSKDVFEPKSTTGIDISSLTFSKGGHQVVLSTWDFSGTQDYYNTHQLFLSGRSVYLVVCNMMQDVQADEGVIQWLELISRTVNPPPPVILVGTHLDDKACGAKFRKQFWQRIKGKVAQKYSNIVSYEAISARHNKKIDGLYERVIKTCMQQDYMPQQVMQGYQYLIERIALIRSLMKTPMTSFNRFKEEIQCCGIQPEKVEETMDFLSSSGFIVYFSTVCPSLVFLEPQWIVDLISSFNQIKQYASRGMVDRLELQNIWDPQKYPERYHEYILMLLERFDLCMRVREQGKIFFAELLEEEATPSQQNMNIMWPPGYEMEEPEFRRIIKYNFVTNTLFPRIIGKLVHANKWDFDHYWSNGSILVKQDGNRCLLRMDPLSKQLFIVVRGEAAAENLLSILETVNQMNISLSISDTEEFVPCTHCLLLEEDAKPFLFHLKDFHEALNEGKEYVLCQGEVAVKLRALLPFGTLEYEEPVQEIEEVEE